MQLSADKSPLPQRAVPSSTGGAKRGRMPGSKNRVAEGEADAGDGKVATKKKGKRTMSSEAREKIAAAQRKRWAKTKKAAKKAAAGES